MVKASNNESYLKVKSVDDLCTDLDNRSDTPKTERAVDTCSHESPHHTSLICSLPDWPGISNRGVETRQYERSSNGRLAVSIRSTMTVCWYREENVCASSRLFGICLASSNRILSLHFLL